MAPPRAQAKSYLMVTIAGFFAPGFHITREMTTMAAATTDLN